MVFLRLLSERFQRVRVSGPFFFASEEARHRVPDKRSYFVGPIESRCTRARDRDL